ncbi:MAG TPA: adenylate/guanylate cyclase domain-containing protein [Lichenihabitans sp.]|jgi:class 3 adenylate cyclase|nr:adenylate/guanylate cyclase domain-containing protein [Lichenihabitans sp.]
MSETSTLFEILGRSADPKAAAAIEALVRDGTDRDLNRINALALAARCGLPEHDMTSAFLHAARLGLFDMSWNVLCPGCGGVLDAGTTLKSVNRAEYHCLLCAAGYEPTLDEMVEVTFTVSPRARRIAAHDPDSLPMWEYARQMFWSSGVDLPEDFSEIVERTVLDGVELPPGERALLSLQLPEAFVIAFDPVTHATQFLDVKGEPTKERQSLTLVLNETHAQRETQVMRPGPLRIAIENRTSRRVLPSLWIAGEDLHALLGRRRPFLTAKHLLTNQTFRQIYRTDTLDVNQRLKITSLTFLFTDLRGSTELYERVGDLVAYDLVQAHFELLTDVVAAEGGAVVKTIGDAVMATFMTPDRALAAALRMRAAMEKLNRDRNRQDLLLKIGLHEGPCLAVTLNDRQDYFGQTVNIASRVQNIAGSNAIVATKAVAEDPRAMRLLDEQSLRPLLHRAALRGVREDYPLYEIL